MPRNTSTVDNASGLITAIAQAQPGDVILLREGSYHLTAPLVIRKSLCLGGEGMEKCRIVSEAEGCIISLEGDCEWRVQGITFQHQGTKRAHVMVVNKGAVHLRRCTFTGGIVDDRDDIGRYDSDEGDVAQDGGGNGLLLKGTTQAQVTDCGFFENHNNGILVRSRAKAILERNHCRKNERSGISYDDNATGVARNNECKDNELSGILVTTEAKVVLEDNLCANQILGIYCWIGAKGEVRNNECSGNGVGIMVASNAQPLLEGNQCNENKRTGITYENEAAGTAHDNECMNNGEHGIDVAGQAHPALKDNRCRANQNNGIYYRGEAAGTAHNNECVGNVDYHGISVTGQSKPILISNRCCHNKLNGIGYYDHAQGKANGNECNHNGFYGIFVTGQSQPVLDGNLCRQNACSGICYSQDAKGIASDNVCTENQQYDGISLEDQAQPSLDNNYCQKNKWNGIAYYGNAAGTARNNECIENNVGILIKPSANPVLLNNHCSHNLDHDVLDQRQIIEREEVTALSEEAASESLDELIAELNSYTGFESVKAKVQELVNFLKVQRLRQDRGLHADPISYHQVFYGNPGTGKTTIARLLARIFKALNILSEGHLVETDRSGLVGGYLGQTALKVQEKVKEALGGVLFIDEAYSLYERDGDMYGTEAVATLLKLIEDHRDDLIVIVAGYKHKMNKFLDSNPGLRSRFNNYLYFADYTPAQLVEICGKMAETSSFELSDAARKNLLALFKEAYSKRDETFGNGRLARNIFEQAIRRQHNRVATIANINTERLSVIEDVDIPLEFSADGGLTDTEEQSRSLDELLNELNSMTGLEAVKSDVARLVSSLQIQQLRQAKGLTTAPVSRHLIFTGNPGTGKTTVARLLAQIYKALNILSRGHLIETDRSGLVAGWLGQTALKVQDVVKQARGGILFIDEAYSLAGGRRGMDEFGEEAISTLLKLMEDYRDDLIVIAAGYTNEMQHFLDTNPGLQSRFNKYLHFEDYNHIQLGEISEKFTKDQGYHMTQSAREKLLAHFQKLCANKDEKFGNGRLARNIFEQTISNQNSRVISLKDHSDQVLSTIEAEDIPSEIDESQPVAGPIVEQHNSHRVAAPPATPTEAEAIQRLPRELQEIYNELRKRVLLFGPDVQTKATHRNLIFKAAKNFAEIKPRKGGLIFFIRPEGFDIPEKQSAQVHGLTVTRVPDSNLWTLTHWFKVDEATDLDAAERLLLQSYGAVKI